MGIESFLRVMDVEGLQTYRTAPRETAWADIFATLESIRYLYDNEVEKQEAEYVAHLCEDVPAFLEGMDNRLGEFTEFADEVARLATNPEAATGSSLATASSVATAIGPALGKLEDACKRRDELPAASEAAAWAAEMEELTRKDAPDKKKQFSDLYQRLLAAARGRADAIRAFRGAARELSNAAGCACAERPKLYPTALWLRTHAQGVLRNRYYFEDDWRGELQRPPPFWLGPSPY
jgi:hypothetical protein